MTAEVTQRGATSEDFDPITFSVLLGRFDDIAREMTSTLELAAWSAVLALAHDYSCAIYDAGPRQIGMHDALPVHTTSLHLILEDIAEVFEGDLHDGDIFMSNAPYRNNTHVADVVTATPVFVEGQHLFWAVTKAHQLDIGAAVPSSLSAAVKDVFDEGLHIPPIRIYDAGKPRLDVIELYLANLRYRDVLKGDLLAQLGSITKGKQRLAELVAEYGAEQLLRYADAIIDYADRRMSAEVEALADGEYEAEGWIDSDGGENLNIPIKLKLKVEGDRVLCDYTGSAPQTATGINGTWAVASSAGAIPFMYYKDPSIPHNQGCFEHIDVIAPEGTICNAKYPASTSMATIVPADMMHDCVNKAMAAVLPDRVVAGGPRAANMPQFSGIDSETGREWALQFYNGSGGGGAGKDTDGWPIIATLAAMGGLKSLAIEQMELLYPVVVEQMEIEPDSMGFGQWIGGPGVRFSCRAARGDIDVITFGDGCDNPPHGILGGTPGIGGGQYVEPPQGGDRIFYSPSAYYRIPDTYRRVGVSSGGGGYGRPEERDAEQVRRDVRDGIVSREAAAEHFGVVLTGAGAEAAIDEAATAARRAELARVERPLVTPDGPAAATWVADTMRPNDVYRLNPTEVEK